MVPQDVWELHKDQVEDASTDEKGTPLEFIPQAHPSCCLGWGHLPPELLFSACWWSIAPLWYVHSLVPMMPAVGEKVAKVHVFGTDVISFTGS